jgi:DNA-binding response OmpR family regulator
MQNKTPHVIVCDDDAELNSFIRSHFKLDGYETHQALSAKECIDKLAELGDIIYAITVNGKIASDRSIMLILNAKRINKNVKIFVLADEGLSEEKTRIMDYGADEFALKPLSMESLINKVNLKLLEAAKSAAAAAPPS